MEWFWEQYLRSPVDGYNPFAAPLRAPPALLGRLAPAIVLTVGFDPLREEGGAYAERLAEAGVTVDHRHYPDLPHGFLSFVEESDRADRAMSEAARSLRSSIRGPSYPSPEAAATIALRGRESRYVLATGRSKGE